MNADLVPVHEVDKFWPAISERVVKCLLKTPTYFTAGEALTMCRSGSAFLIITHDNEKTTGGSIWQFEGDSFVCLVWVGSESAETVPALFERAAQIARDCGVSRLMGTGREGLIKPLKKHLKGVKIHRITFTVEV